MCISFRFLVSVLFILLISLLHACLKDKHEVPSVSTKEIVDITANNATSGGEIISNGGLNIISSGVCWDTADYPADMNYSTNEGGDLQTFTSIITDLKPHTGYYVRAYAENSTGIGYGESFFFTTLGDVPAASTSSATYITFTAGTLNGTVNPNHLSTSVAFEYGTSTDYGNSIAASQSPVTGDSLVSVNINLTGLIPGTVYNFRIKTINDLGTIYGENQTFKTLAPEAKTLSATDITATSATLNGLANTHGISSSLVFMFGKESTNNQVIFDNSAVAIPTLLNSYSDTPITASLSGLIPGSTYHFYLQMLNEMGTYSGYDYRFTTLPITVITNEPKYITENSATLTGIVNANNTTIAVAVEYGEYPFGFWNSTPGTLVFGIPSPVSGNTNTLVSVTITGLLPGKMYSYFFEAFGPGWNIRGVSHDIKTKNLLFNQDVTYDTLNDIEGNTYRTIQLGTQIWMAENLKTTQYNDGAPIPVGVSTVASNTDSYRWYGNRGDYLADYGAMYNWYAVNTGKLCPVGWHVPGYDEWVQLVTYSGGESIAGGKLKETGTGHWNNPNAGADNSTGFTAVGAGNNEDMFGLTDPGGSQWNLKSLTYYWVQNDLDNLVLELNANSTGAYFRDFYPNRYHCSVRCLKD